MNTPYYLPLHIMVTYCEHTMYYIITLLFVVVQYEHCIEASTWAAWYITSLQSLNSISCVQCHFNCEFTCSLIAHGMEMSCHCHYPSSEEDRQLEQWKQHCPTPAVEQDRADHPTMCAGHTVQGLLTVVFNTDEGWHWIGRCVVLSSGLMTSGDQVKTLWTLMSMQPELFELAVGC